MSDRPGGFFVEETAAPGARFSRFRKFAPAFPDLYNPDDSAKYYSRIILGGAKR